MGSLRFFKMHLRVPFLLLALLEFFVCIIAVYVAVYVRFDGRLSETDLERFNIQSPVLTAILFGLVMPTTMMAMGLYQSRFRGGIMGVFLRSISGFVAGGAILAMFYYVIPALYLGRGVFAIAIVVAFFMVGTIRPLFFYYVDRDLLKIRILVCGSGAAAASISQRLRRRVDRRGFNIFAYIKTLSRADQSQQTDVEIKNAPLIDLPSSLLDYCIENEIDEIVVAMDEKRNATPMDELLRCKLNGIEVIDILGFFEREQGKIPLDIMRPDWLVYSDGFDRSALKAVMKRVFDIVASLLILAITWPFMLLAVIAIKFEEGLAAPLLYRQERVGLLGKVFPVLKFRSMGVNAEKDGVAQWATENDNRVTRAGAFMRKTRIDELPQIVNVLRGDMSFVGPRPERPQFVEELATEIPYYRERHAVKPGITGWAQVCYPYGASIKDSIQKQEFDLYYIKNHTIFLDILILCQTAEVVLFGKGGR